MYATKKSNKVNPYLVKEIMEANPKQLLFKVYDFAIINCQKRNMVKANEAVQILISALRFDGEKDKEIALGLFRLYQYCQEEMRKGNFEIASRFLTELREQWQKALNEQG